MELRGRRPPAHVVVCEGPFYALSESTLQPSVSSSWTRGPSREPSIQVTTNSLPLRWSQSSMKLRSSSTMRPCSQRSYISALARAVHVEFWTSDAEAARIARVRRDTESHAGRSRGATVERRHAESKASTDGGECRASSFDCLAPRPSPARARELRFIQGMGACDWSTNFTCSLYEWSTNLVCYSQSAAAKHERCSIIYYVW